MIRGVESFESRPKDIGLWLGWLNRTCSIMRWCFRKACCNDIWQTTSNISTKMLDQKSLESNNNNKDTKCTPNCKQRATQAKNYELVLKRTMEQFENER